MPAIDSTLFDDIDSAISDLRGSTFQTFERPLRRLSGLLHSPELENLNKSLTSDVSFDAFYKESISSGGSMVGSHRLAWPPEREKELGLTLVLIDRLASDPGWAIDFGHTFFYSGSKIIAGVHTFADQVLIPFARDYRKYVERQLTAPDASGKALDMARAPISIFISHIHEEAAIAKTLKQWLEASFPGHISAFVSSDYEDLPLGKRWLAEIEAAMDRSRLLITLISPASFERMWIHLEAGWALGREVEVLPICHSGRSVGQLPRPYSDWSGVDIEADDFAGRLLEAFKSRLGLDHPLPKGMIDALNTNIREVASTTAPAKSARGSGVGEADEFELDDVELSILLFLLELHDRGQEPFKPAIATRLGIGLAKTDYHLKRLEQAGLAEVAALIINQGARYGLTDAGIEFLVKRGKVK